VTHVKRRDAYSWDVSASATVVGSAKRGPVAGSAVSKDDLR